ncbi:MAG: hypothetical protein KAR06_10565 [Deltaproteobacteria bacterium]|nr:hypothetical protein [Deltaproteobacteria bacterium]
MAFWNKVSKELKKAAHEGWEAVSAGAKVAKVKGEEVAKVGKLKYKAHNTHRKAEKLFAELGGLVFEVAEKDTKDNPLDKAAIKSVIANIKKIETEADKLEDKIKDVKKKEKANKKKITAKPKAKTTKKVTAARKPNKKS